MNAERRLICKSCGAPAIEEGGSLCPGCVDKVLDQTGSAKQEYFNQEVRRRNLMKIGVCFLLFIVMFGPLVLSRYNIEISFLLSLGVSSLVLGLWGEMPIRSELEEISLAVNELFYGDEPGFCLHLSLSFFNLFALSLTLMCICGLFYGQMAGRYELRKYFSDVFSTLVGDS